MLCATIHHWKNSCLAQPFEGPRFNSFSTSSVLTVLIAFSVGLFKKSVGVRSFFRCAVHWKKLPVLYAMVSCSLIFGVLWHLVPLFCKVCLKPLHHKTTNTTKIPNPNTKVFCGAPSDLGNSSTSSQNLQSQVIFWPHLRSSARKNPTPIWRQKTWCSERKFGCFFWENFILWQGLSRPFIDHLGWDDENPQVKHQHQGAWILVQKETGLAYSAAVSSTMDNFRLFLHFT